MAAPAVIIDCLRLPLIMRVQRETFTFKHTRLELCSILFFCLYGFIFLPITNLQFCPHKAKGLGDEREIQSTTQLLCLHCEYQQAPGPSSETCPSPSFAGCYAGTAVSVLKQNQWVVFSLFLCKMCMIPTLGKLGHSLKEKKKGFLFCFVFSLVLPFVLFSYP